MLKIVYEFLFYIFAIYGFIFLVAGIYNRIKIRKTNTEGIQMILTVENKQDTVEGLIRSIFLNGILDKLLLKKLTVIDMASSDDTPDILKRLEEEYPRLDVIKHTKKYLSLDENIL